MINDNAYIYGADAIVNKCKKCSLYTLLTATDRKPQKNHKKAMLTTLT